MLYDVSAYDEFTLKQIVELHPEAIAEASQSVCVGFAAEGSKLLRVIINQAGDKEVPVQTLLSWHEQKDPWEKYVTTGLEMLQKDVAWPPHAVSYKDIIQTSTDVVAKLARATEMKKAAYGTFDFEAALDVYR